MHLDKRAADIYASKPLECRICVCIVSKRREYKSARYPGHSSVHKGAAQVLLLHIGLPSIASFGLRQFSVPNNGGYSIWAVLNSFEERIYLGGRQPENERKYCAPHCWYFSLTIRSAKKINR
jgi:hypothetical protein